MKKSTLLLSTAIAMALPLSAEARPFEWRGVSTTDVAVGQLNIDDVRAYADVEMDGDHADINHVEVDTTAVGNNFAVEGGYVSADYTNVLVGQMNDGEALADVDVDLEDYRTDFNAIEIDTTAVANNASIEVTEWTNDVDVDSMQVNDPSSSYDEVEANADIDIDGDAHSFDAATTAVGNNLSVDVADGLDDVDSIQKNFSEVSAYATVDIDDVYVGDVATTAVGNNVAIETDYDLDDVTSFQMNTGDIYASTHGSFGDVEHLDVSTTAVGNNLSVEGYEMDDLGSMQLNYDDIDAVAVIDIDEAFNVDISTTAVANNLAVELSGDFFDNVHALQVNTDDVKARTHVTGDFGGHANVSVSTTAVGNNVSISVGTAD